MSKKREKEYLEKLGIPSDDYSSVPVDRSFSLDDILREVEGKSHEKEAASSKSHSMEKPKPTVKPQPKPAAEPHSMEKPQPQPKPAVKPAPKPTETEENEFSLAFPSFRRAPAEQKPKTEAPKAEAKNELRDEQIPLTHAEAKPEPETEPKAEPKSKSAPAEQKPRPIKRGRPRGEKTLKLFNTIEIEGKPKEYDVAVEEGGEPKVNGSTVVFAPPPAASKTKRKRAAKKQVISEAEPEQLYFEGAAPKNVITTPREAPADKVAAGFGESVENHIRGEARKALSLPEESPVDWQMEFAKVEEYHGEPDDRAEVEEKLKARKTDGILKSIFIAASVLVLLIIDLFALRSEAAAGETDIAVMYLLLNAAISVLTLAFAAPAVKKGFKQIITFSLRAEADAFLCTVVAVIQNIILVIISPAAVADGTAEVYNFIPAMMLLFIRLSDLKVVRHIRASLDFLSSKKNLSAAVMIDDDDLTDDLVAGQVSGEPRVCAPRKADGFVGVADACEQQSGADRAAGKLFYFTAAGALVIAVLSAVWRGASLSVAFSIFTAALCAGTPLMSVFITILPLTKLSRALNKKGGAILNFGEAASVAEANCIVISDADAFPAHSIILRGMSIFNNAPVDAVITDTVAVLNAAGGALGKVFEGSIADKSILPEIDSIEYVDEMGIVCHSAGRELLLGCRDFMKTYQIPVPSSVYEARVLGGDRHVFYLASNMQLCATYIVTYGVSDLAKRRLHRAESAGLTLLIATMDTNVTKEILSNHMKLNNASVKVISARALDRLERSLKKAKTISAGIIISDECCALPETAVCAAKLKNIVAFNIAALIASAVIGLVLVAIFSLAPVPTALRAWKIIIYALFWALPLPTLSSTYK